MATITWIDRDGDNKLPYFRMWVDTPDTDWVAYAEREDWATTNCGPFRVFFWRNLSDERDYLGFAWREEPHKFATLEEAQRYAEVVWRLGT